MKLENSDAFMQISFKKEFLKKNNLINIEYPVPLDLATKISAKDSHIDFADMLFWLQEYSSSLKNDSWEDLEPAMLRLSEVIAQKNNDPVGNIHTPDFYIHVQPHKLDKELISIMRRDKVLAVILPGDKDNQIAFFSRSMHWRNSSINFVCCWCYRWKHGEII